MTTINLLYLFIILCMMKILINLNKYILTKYYFNMYNKFLTRNIWQISEYKQQILKLFKDTGMKDSYFASYPIESGFPMPTTISHFENFLNRRDDIVQRTSSCFYQSMGLYRSRILETFNPIFWIEYIIHLPRELFKYIGIAEESIIIKISQFIYWLIISIFSVLYALYKPEVDIFIKNILK